MINFNVKSTTKVKQVETESGAVRYSFGSYKDHLTDWASKKHAQLCLEFVKAIIKLVTKDLTLHYATASVDFSYSSGRVYIHAKDSDRDPSWDRTIEFRMNDDVRYRSPRDEDKNKPFFWYTFHYQQVGTDKSLDHEGACKVLNLMEESTAIAHNIAVLIETMFTEERGAEIHDEYEKIRLELKVKAEAVSDRKAIFGNDYLAVRKGEDSINVQQTWMNIFAMTSIMVGERNWINKQDVSRVFHEFGMGLYVKEHQIGTYLSYLAKVVDFPISKGKNSGTYVVEYAYVGDLLSQAEDAKIL